MMPGPSMRRRVTIVAAGGTISSVSRGVGTAATPTLGADQLVEQVPQLRDLADLDTVTYQALPSPHLSFRDVFELHALAEVALGGGADGVVVTSGTDTLEEVAFALDVLWEHPNPLVVTGAMRNASLAGPDGPANLFAAACVAASVTARERGVLVVFNDEIHAAVLVQKRHTTSVATFGSPDLGPLGRVSEGRPHFVWSQKRSGITISRVQLRTADIPSVALLHMGLGEDERLLKAIADLRYAGLVVAGFGGGHVSKDIADGRVLDALAQRVPVILSSRTRSGWLLEGTYGGFAGSETDLLERGLISAGMLDPFKARVLLTLLLMDDRYRQRAAVANAFSAFGLRA